MTAEEFVSNVKDEVFKETFEYYFKMLPNPIAGTDKNWKTSKELYHSLNEEQKQQMQTFTKMVMQDVVSIIFGKLDNISSFANQKGDFELTINGNVISGDLQELFLMGIDS
ncbi:hypothetical protein [Prevotella pallens]|uniref:hypothetical protein n=1 Tax=Prevotella pallens TaxID=60133 RepID=UPI0023F26657|nr:hypothetical protein [Prevotella pallens]